MPASRSADPPSRTRRPVGLRAHRTRIWTLMVPIHLLAFLALYVASARLFQVGLVEVTSEAAKLILSQAVGELVIVPPGAAEGGRTHLFETAPQAQHDFSMRLLTLSGAPLAGGPRSQVDADLASFLASDEHERFWVAPGSDGSRLRGAVRVAAGPRCAPCHELGGPLAVASVELDFSSLLRRTRGRLRLNIGLLILAWVAVVGLTTGVVKRSVERSAARLEAQIAAGEEGAGAPFDDRAELILDPRSAQLHETLREMYRRQRRREAEVASKLAHTNRLAALGQLAAGLVHEIKNPLAGIQGALEILREDAKEGDNRSLYDEMLAELGRVNRTLQALLTSARPSPPHRIEVELHDLLGQMATLMSPGLRRRSVELRVEAPARLMAKIDPAQIRQVLVNLVNNAADALVEGGHVTLRAAAFPDGEGVILGVEDDGPGISPEDQKKVFEPFFTTKFSGTGLGLTIARSLVEQHGGVLQVESAPGGGTRFLLFLPAGEADEPEVEGSQPS